MSLFSAFCQNEIEPLVAKFEDRVGLALLFQSESYQYHAEKVFSAASTIKVPLLITALKKDPSSLITAPLPKTGGSSLLEYFNGSHAYSLHDLLLAMISISDNSATNAVIDFLGGTAKIKQGFLELGLVKTQLNRKMMDFEAKEKGLDNTATPLEMVTLLSQLTPDYLARVRYYLSKQLRSEGLGFFLEEDAAEHKTGSLYTVFNDVGLMKLDQQLLIYAYYSEDINIGESIVLAGKIGQAIKRWFENENHSS